MKTKSNKEIFVSVRVSAEELQLWEQAQHEQGFLFRSSFMRHHTNIGARTEPEKVSIRADEQTLHLKRIGSTLSELSTLAANDNALNDPTLRERIDDALNHVFAIKG